MPGTSESMQANGKSGSVPDGGSSMSRKSSPMASAHWRQVPCHPRRAWRHHGAQLGLADLGHWRRAWEKQPAVRGCLLLAASLMPPVWANPGNFARKSGPTPPKKLVPHLEKISSSSRDRGWRIDTSSAACVARCDCSGPKACADRWARAAGLDCEVTSPRWRRKTTSSVSSRWPSPISPGSPTTPTPEPTKTVSTWQLWTICSRAK